MVYKVFFRELAASQRAADQRRDKGEDDTGLRTLFRHAFGLTDYEHQVLVSTAQTCVTALEDNLRSTQQLAQELKQTQDKAPVQAQLAKVLAASEASVSGGVQQLRLSISPERFARLDLMIRVHVVPNLKIIRGPAPVKATHGGD